MINIQPSHQTLFASVLTEVRFVPPVTAGGNFCQRCKFNHFHSFFVFLSVKLLKLGEIDGVKVLAWISVIVKFWTNLMAGCYFNLRWLCLNLRSSSKYQKLVFEIKLQAAVLEKNWWCCQARGSKLVQALRLLWQNSLSSSPPEFTCRPKDGNRLKMRVALRCQIKGEASWKIGDDQTKSEIDSEMCILHPCSRS